LPAGLALLILDEPTVHLDPEACQALTADLLQATEGRSVLLITHQRDGPGKVGQIVELSPAAPPRRVYQRMWESEQEPA
jgi:ABC-type transport system involved in cytochrome bd biosynthesis fused ATPase/permease subunit